VQARARARAHARASFWKTGNHQHRRHIREMQFRVKRIAAPRRLRSQCCGLPTANCQLPSAKPICRSCRDKQGFDQAQAKHKHKHKQANAIAAVQTVQHIAVAAVHCFPTPPKRSCRVPYHVCIRTYAVSLFASRSKFTRCRGSVPPYGTACFGVPPEMN
jgi:hypothetical protein